MSVKWQYCVTLLFSLTAVYLVLSANSLVGSPNKLILTYVSSINDFSNFTSATNIFFDTFKLPQFLMSSTNMSLEVPICDAKLCDEKSINYVKQHMIGPSIKNYNLTDPTKADYSQNGQHTHLITKYFKKKRNGIFFECGAFSGELLSNTLALERDYNWTGVLVEADPANFADILTKNRRAYTLSACLWNVTTPVRLSLDPSIPGSGRQVLARVEMDPSKGMMCLPIGAVLHVLNYTHVDLIILDTESTEERILVAFPWKTVTVDVFMIERGQIDGPKDIFLKKFFPLMGYSYVEFFKTLDDIYVRNGFVI